MTLKRLRLTVLMALVSAMIFALVPASPASATHVTGVIAGTASLSHGLDAPSGTFTFSGAAAGVISGSPDAGTASASGSYSNSGTVTGTASGTITLSGLLGNSSSCSLSWSRTGVVATVSACGHTYAAVFVPTGLNSAAVAAAGGVI